MIDEDFELFLSEFGQGSKLQLASSKIIEFWRNKLPDQLLIYWQQQGFGAYLNGLFWIVDPALLQNVTMQWLANTAILKKDNFYPFARSAFGDIYVCGEVTGAILHINCLSNTIIATSAKFEHQTKDRKDRLMRSFFGASFIEDFDRKDIFKKNLFNQACASVGLLEMDEMYAFEPALILGGMPLRENVVKVKMDIHLSILRQIAEPQIIY